MNSKKIFGLVLTAFALSFGCAHQAPPAPPLRPVHLGQALPGFGTAPNADPEPEPVVAAKPERDDAKVELAAYRAVSELERYAGSGVSPDQDQIDGLVTTASTSLAAAKGAIEEKAYDQLDNKIGALTQTLRLDYAERMLEKLRYFDYSADPAAPTAEDVISDTENAVLRAKRAGADVELLQKQLPALSQRARALQAKKSAQRQTGVAAP